MGARVPFGTLTYKRQSYQRIKRTGVSVLLELEVLNWWVGPITIYLCDCCLTYPSIGFVSNKSSDGEQCHWNAVLLVRGATDL